MPDVVDALDEVMDSMLDAVRKGGDVAAAANDKREAIEDVYLTIYETALPMFAEERYEQYNTKSVRQVPESLFEKWLRIAREFIATRPMQARITQVLDTTIEWVNELTAEGLREGLTTDQVATQIQEKWTDPESPINRFRAERISRTETISAANKGSQQGVIDSDVDALKFWISATDDRVRDAHDTGQNPSLSVPIPLTDPYIVDNEALMFPGDPAGSAHNVINCRCVEGYEVI